MWLTSEWANKPNRASRHKTDAAVPHLSFLPPLPYCSPHDWNEREREWEREWEHQHPPKHSLICERRERRWQPTQALVNLTSNLPVFKVHTEKEVTGGTWKKVHTLSLSHTHRHTHTHTHCTCPQISNLLLKSSTISHSSLHCKLPLRTCVRSCVCVYVCVCVWVNQWFCRRTTCSVWLSSP